MQLLVNLAERASIATALFVALATVFAPAAAEQPLLVPGIRQPSPPATKYPWDVRPESCSDRDKAQQPECQLHSWPNSETAIWRITKLYEAEEFHLVDRALRELAWSMRRFPDGSNYVGAAYWAFRQLMPAPGTEPHLRERITRWKNATPNSPFVAFAEARFTYGQAWSIRGSGYGSSVSKESWELFSLGLQEAEQKLLDAPAELKTSPMWHQLLLAITLDSPRPQNRPDEVFETAVKNWPQYFDLYELRLTRLTPRWGGSWERIESFIDYWSRQLSDREGRSMYARLYTSLKDQGIAPHETALNWNKMRDSFEDLLERYPTARFKNLYATYACAARDKDAFGSAMRKMTPQQLNPRLWLWGHSYEGCMRWAAT